MKGLRRTARGACRVGRTDVIGRRGGGEGTGGRNDRAVGPGDQSIWWESQEGVAASDCAVVRQGAIETANVEPVRLLVSVIETSRAYEAYQKVIQAFNDTAGRAVNDIAGRA